MSRIFVVTSSAIAAIAPALAWAQAPAPGPGPGYGYGHHMMWGGGGMVFHSLFMLVTLALIVAGVIALIRWMSGYGHHHHRQWREIHNGRPPLDILKERFARGEIDKQEFEERRKVLGE